MNQDQVKEKLQLLKSDVPPFTVVFTGKKSKRVDGLYKPESREILIHNKNMSDDDAVMYTAIHEFAHHVHFSTSPVPISSRSHTNAFWNIFHELLGKAEEEGTCVNRFDSLPEFRELTRRIRTEFLSTDGKLMQEFGKTLIEAMELCRQHGLSFEDYVDRTLGVHRNTAKTIMRVYSEDVPPEYGFENMKLLARIKDPGERKRAQEAFDQGLSPDMIRARFVQASPGSDSESDPLEALTREKERIEHTIETLNTKLRRIEGRIERIRGEFGRETEE